MFLSTDRASAEGHDVGRLLSILSKNDNYRPSRPRVVIQYIVIGIVHSTAYLHTCSTRSLYKSGTKMMVRKERSFFHCFSIGCTVMTIPMYSDMAILLLKVSIISSYC